MNPTHNFRSDIALAQYSNCRELWDTPVLESTSFVALPTVGAFIEGWLLVVPREQALSFAQLPDHLWSEANDFLAEVAERVEAQYGPVAIFEHGPAIKQSPVGCGVDYAHFHVVPTSIDLRASASESFPAVTWKPFPEMSSVRSFRSRSEGYWAVSQKEYSPEWWVGTISNQVPPNQLFRRVLARAVGLDESRFDWRNSLGQSLISATVEKLACDLAAHE